MAKLSIGKAWEETVPFVKREGHLLFPVAFALIALPIVVLMQMLPADYTGFTAGAGGAKPQPLPPMYSLGFMVVAVLSMMGALTIYALALRPGISVGEALMRAMRRTPALLGALLLVGMAVGLIMLVLVLVLGMLAAAVGPAAAAALLPILVGGLLTLASARFLLLNVVVAEEGLGVLASIRRGWDITRGQLWRLVVFLIIFFALLIVVQSAAQGILGVVGTLIGGPDIGRLLGGLAGAIAGGVIQVYLLVMTARIYLQLRA